MKEGHRGERPEGTASESRKYSTAEGRRSGWSAEGGEEPTTHTSSLTCCRPKDGGHEQRQTGGDDTEDGGHGKGET